MAGYNSLSIGQVKVGVKEMNQHTRSFQDHSVRDGAKRFLDIALSGAGVLVAAPLGALIAAAIRVTSTGPVIFSQMRLGKNGRRFTIYKFRTLPPQPASRSDAQWTEVMPAEAGALGRWLRRTGLDELPQLWNVLRGDMSLVGPRPERPTFAERFRREYPRYKQRLQVKPGITGWAQVHGLRGRCDIGERLRFDLHYLKHQSLWLDLQILLLTPLGLLRSPRDAAPQSEPRQFPSAAHDMIGAD